MAGKIRNLVDRNGRYYARLVVPKELRRIIGKTELRKPLGGDYRQALKDHPSAVASLQAQISEAERKAGKGQEARYPMTASEMALAHYTGRLEFDEELRNDPRYASVGIDDGYVRDVREGIAGRASDQLLQELVGFELEKFRAAGNFDAAIGSDGWRIAARALCKAEYEALTRAYERDEGDYGGEVKDPMLVTQLNAPKPAARVSLKNMTEDYIAVRIAAGSMKDGGRRQRNVVENLCKFLKHSDAARVTKKDMLLWRDCLLKKFSSKTVSDTYLSATRSMYSWAVDNDFLEENPVSSVKVPKTKRVYGREKGYTDEEALKVLRASRAYKPNTDENGYTREKPHLVAAKQWVPLICAFTGARVTEITQLRKQDVRQDAEGWVIRITPDAGTVKAGGYRDVPLHAQIIDEGFDEFWQQAGEGPLFHNGQKPEDYVRKSKQIGNQIGDWLRETKLRPDGIQPNHAWRHRLKTQCIELGISDRVMDAIQGHAGTTASHGYGDVTLKAKRNAIEHLPLFKFIESDQ